MTRARRALGARREAVVAGLAALAAAAVLSGCTVPGTASSSSAERSSTAASGPAPAVDAGQVHRILASVAATSPDALDARLDGAELEVRRAALAVRAEVPTSPELTPLAGEELLAAVPAAGTWPRWFLTAVRPSADAVPQVLVLAQAGPRDPYKVVAAATLLPGAELPQVVDAGGVAEALDPAAAGLLTTPAQAVAGYADVLADGADSSAAATTADDAFRTQVAAEQASERDGVSEYVEYTAAHTPRQGALWSLRTSDGGALVIAVLDGERTFTPRGVGVSQSLPADLAVLAGRDSAPDGLDVRTAEVVVLHVPPAGDGGKVSLVAGQRGTTAVQVR